MAKMVQVEVFVCVNEDGDFVSHEDRYTCGERMREEIGGDMTRMIRVVLSVPVPETITMTGVVPAEPTEGTLTATSVEN